MSEICTTYEYANYSYQTCNTPEIFVASACLEIVLLFFLFAVFSQVWWRLVHKVTGRTKKRDSGQGAWPRGHSENEEQRRDSP